VLFCLWTLSLRSIWDASNAFSAVAKHLVFCKKIWALQYGHVRVFWVLAASSKPLHRLHSSMTVAGILGAF